VKCPQTLRIFKVFLPSKFGMVGSIFSKATVCFCVPRTISNGTGMCAIHQTKLLTPTVGLTLIQTHKSYPPCFQDLRREAENGGDVATQKISLKLPFSCERSLQPLRALEVYSVRWNATREHLAVIFGFSRLQFWYVCAFCEAKRFASCSDQVRCPTLWPWI
jgi:hypothetical protein